MRERHGTPAQFEISVYRAVPAFITVQEADLAVERYRIEWAALPDEVPV